MRRPEPPNLPLFGEKVRTLTYLGLPKFTFKTSVLLREASNYHLKRVDFAGSQVLASGTVQVPRFTLLESGGLQILPIMLSDAGNYTCSVSNTEGLVSGTGALTVLSTDAYYYDFIMTLKLKKTNNVLDIQPERH